MNSVESTCLTTRRHATTRTYLPCPFGASATERPGICRVEVWALISNAHRSAVRLQAAGEGVNTCDFPPVLLEKAMWAGLSVYAPPVAQLMQRFFLEERVTVAIEAMMESEKLGVVSAVCTWMRAEENRPVWEAWLPPARYWVECELGEIVVDGKSCKACPPGTFSSENYATECLQCSPGEAC